MQTTERGDGCLRYRIYLSPGLLGLRFDDTQGESGCCGMHNSIGTGVHINLDCHCSSARYIHSQATRVLLWIVAIMHELGFKLCSGVSPGTAATTSKTNHSSISRLLLSWILFQTIQLYSTLRRNLEEPEFHANLISYGTNSDSSTTGHVLQMLAPK
jgi:hypothetical protein